MTEVAATQVFVPRIFDAPDTRGVVVKAYKLEGEFVDAQEPLIDLQSHDIDGEIVAPFAGTVVRLHTTHGDMVSAGTLLADLRVHVPEPAPPTTGLRPRVSAQVSRVVVLALAAPALVAPLLWLLVVLVAGLVLAVAQDVRTRRAAGLGLAPLTLIPRLLAAAARWVGRSLRTIAPLLIGTVRLLVGLIAAVAVPALIGGGLWLFAHGQDGFSAAARIAVADHAFRVFAFIACLWFVGRLCRAAGLGPALRQRALRVPLAVSLPACLAALAWTAVSAVVLPRSLWAPTGGFEEAVALLPSGATDWVRRERAAWAQADAAAMSSCLADAGRGSWRSPVVTRRPDGSMVASIGALPGERAGDRSVATLLLAAQNQLEPHPLTVVVHMGGGARLRFETSATSEPTTDIAGLLGRAQLTDAAAERFAGLSAVKPTDVKVALRCSAAGL